MLTRAYDCPSCIDLTKLCVVPGQQCWILYVDVLVSMISLNYVWEGSGSVVEFLTLYRKAAGSSLTGVTVGWSLSKTHLS